MVLNFITWNVNPDIFHLGPLTVRWYGLLFASGFFFGYLIMAKIFQKENIPQPILDKLTLYMALGTILGARLGHCLFYEPAYYLLNPLEILFIWHGGLASHGAAIGIILALYLFAKKTKKPFFWILDRIVIVVALSGFLIRIGNLMNSEIVGRATDLPWGFIFERDVELKGAPRHPTQIYEALVCLVIFIILLIWYKNNYNKKVHGFAFSIFLIILFVFRFFVEFIKDVQVNFENNMMFDMGQILSIPFVLLGIILLFRYYKQLKAKNI